MPRKEAMMQYACTYQRDVTPSGVEIGHENTCLRQSNVQLADENFARNGRVEFNDGDRGSASVLEGRLWSRKRAPMSHWRVRWLKFRPEDAR